MAFDIDIFIQNLGEDLIRIFDRSSKNTNHPDQIGRTKEINVTKQIAAMLPHGIGIGRGFVFDSFGHVSNQCDIIIYEKDYIPVFVQDDNTDYSYYPCEGVIAIGEIKSTLNFEQLSDSTNKLKKIKEMQRALDDNKTFRHYLSTLSVAGAPYEAFDPENKSSDSIFTFVFCNKNIVATDSTLIFLEKENLKSKILSPDRIYSFNKPTITKITTNFKDSHKLWSTNKANTFCSIKTEKFQPFRELIDDLTTIIRTGRTQKFYLERYYHTDMKMKLDLIIKDGVIIKC